jgi:hypothetical protein
MRWGFVVLALLVGSVLLSAGALLPAGALAQTPPDVVILRDGSFLRGTVVEATPAQVVVQLVTGEVRTIPRSEVAELRSDVLGPAPRAEEPPPPPEDVVPIAPLEHAPIGPQVAVRLRLGEIVRGTLIEDSAEAVTLRLADGVTRRIARADVAAVQPLLPQGEPRAAGRTERRRAAPPPTTEASLEVRADREGLSLHRVTGSAAVVVPVGRGMGSAMIDAFSLVCAAPCSTTLPPGDYRLGVAQGDGQPVRASGIAHLGPGYHEVSLSYDDRNGFRVAGWVTFALGAAASAALMSLSLFVGPTECSSITGYCRNTISTPMLVSGAVLFGVSMGVGLGFAFLNDAVEVRTRRR